ncbi:ABC transporter substrate-binding protein [Solwaraspora sp. WMMD1047]|uniref:ABC transporter substrate-binding protein n=1 Tax=Solwaraspora sp. WMMD1047 TaxID=3016102 RepID=UPI00241750D1|nr:ABC transporter substrate-binding protein [Solwaraspora sp. WMMD1047]MDG4828468.1 ABC transporter substrate-binding protein [Solwaraspora sp. WMMD1047]
MRRIRSTTIGVLASALLATSLAGCQFGDSADGEAVAGEIVIAADLELSGALAPVGTAYQRALELKAEQINLSGVLGDRRVRLDVKDNRSDPSESSRNISDFTSNPSVSAVIMGSCNECAINAAKTIDERRVPAIALAPASQGATPADQRRYMFKLAPNAEDSAAALVAELRDLKIKRVALLHTDDAYGLEGVAAMTSQLEKANIQLRQVESVKVTDTDLGQAVASATEIRTDALILWTSAEQAMSAAENAREAEYTGRIYFDAAAAGDLFLEGARSSDNLHLLFTQTMVIDDVIATNPAKAARKQWFRDYTARYGGYYGFSSFAADALQLLVNAATGSATVDEPTNRDGLRDLLETSQMDGLSGPIRMTPDNHSGLMPQALTMLVSRGGRWRLAG